jgi:hypothetical protein
VPHPLLFPLGFEDAVRTAQFEGSVNLLALQVERASWFQVVSEEDVSQELLEPASAILLIWKGDQFAEAAVKSLRLLMPRRSVCATPCTPLRLHIGGSTLHQVSTVVFYFPSNRELAELRPGPAPRIGVVIPPITPRVRVSG